MLGKNIISDNINAVLISHQWGKDRPPTGQFDQYSPQTPLASATSPTAFNPNSPFFPQYGGPMSPQGMCFRNTLQLQ